MRVKPVIGALLFGGGGLGNAIARHNVLTRQGLGRTQASPLTSLQSESTPSGLLGRPVETSPLFNVITDAQATTAGTVSNRWTGASAMTRYQVTSGVTRTTSKTRPRPWWVDRKDSSSSSSSSSDSDSDTDSDPSDSSEDNSWPPVHTTTMWSSTRTRSCSSSPTLSLTSSSSSSWSVSPLSWTVPVPMSMSVSLSLSPSPLLSLSEGSGYGSSDSTTYDSSTTIQSTLVSTSVPIVSFTREEEVYTTRTDSLLFSSSMVVTQSNSPPTGAPWGSSSVVDNYPASLPPSTVSTAAEPSIPSHSITDHSGVSLMSGGALSTTSWINTLYISVSSSGSPAKTTTLAIDPEESDHGDSFPPFEDVWSRTPASGAPRAVVTTIIGKANGGGRRVHFLTTHFTVGVLGDLASQPTTTPTASLEYDCHEQRRQLAKKRKCWKKTYRYLKKMAASIPCAKLKVQRVTLGGKIGKPTFYIKPIRLHDQLTNACMDDLLQRVSTLLHTIPCQRMGLTLVEGRGVIIE